MHRLFTRVPRASTTSIRSTRRTRKRGPERLRLAPATDGWSSVSTRATTSPRVALRITLLFLLPGDIIKKLRLMCSPRVCFRITPLFLLPGDIIKRLRLILALSQRFTETAQAAQAAQALPVEAQAAQALPVEAQAAQAPAGGLNDLAQTDYVLSCKLFLSRLQQKTFCLYYYIESHFKLPELKRS